MGVAHALPAGETELHLVKVAIEVLQPVVAAGGGHPEHEDHLTYYQVESP